MQLICTYKSDFRPPANKPVGTRAFTKPHFVLQYVVNHWTVAPWWYSWSISACHVEDPGSNPSRGGFFLSRVTLMGVLEPGQMLLCRVLLHRWSCIVSGPDWCMPVRIFAGDLKTFWNLICRCPSTTYLRRSKNCEKQFARNWKNQTPSQGLEPWLRGILTRKYSLPQHWWS